VNDIALHFATPELAPLLWVWLGFTGLLVLLERRGSGALDRLVASALQSQLVERPASWRRWLRVALLSLASLCMVLALMRPQWGLRFVATPRVGAEIMIALDVSRSMLADDAKPSRLERAKAEIADLLAYLDQDHVGLIAFAGRASVLSPMTPDRSFLRLVLDGAGAHSVTRGGTNLAEPIQKAVTGLGEPGPAQRALILITDGEDHDSFALDAARQAAEAGIKIIAIGFGDESGSEIYISDPRTGARTLLRDSAGDPVVSRLDGELLREIALATDGAYVPAGTGVLDLASIYQEHIAGLTRSQLDAHGRSIRDEMYGGFVLLAIVCLVAAVASAAGRGDLPSRGGAAAAALMLAATLGAPPAVEAQLASDAGPRASSEAPGTPDAVEPEAEAGETAEPTDEGPAVEEQTPREQFNRATASLAAGDHAVAEALLREARRAATDDSELRYAATYNLGMAAIARSEAIEPADPEQALEALYEGADWFRDASALRPDDADARHNLEVALRKALILADYLAQGDERDLAGELDALLGAQRARVADAASLLEAVARAGELDAAEQLRPAFAQAATEQRTLLADASGLGERAARERDVIAAMSEEERTPQDAMRAGQLEAVLHYLDAALDRMGQARSQLRRRSAERAYRRSSAALAELSRARDQLRDPAEQLGVLMAEVGGLARSSAVLASEGQTLPGASAPLRAPAFLTPESAQLDNERVRQRVDELAARFEAGLEAAAQQAEPPVPEQEAMLQAVSDAAPFVSAAAFELVDAGRALGDQRYGDALDAQRRAGEALSEAREQFFDLRQLLEAAYQDEQRIAEVASSDDETGLRDEYAAALRELQHRNLGRGERLDAMLREQIEQLEDAEAAASLEAEGNPDAQQQLAAASEAQRQRLGVASQLLIQAVAAMDDARQALGEGDATAHWPEVAAAAERSAEQLETLRTLFFSIVEHVRELARLQLDLTDHTRDAVALAAAETPPPPAPEPAPAASPDPTGSPEAADPAETAGEPPAPVRGPQTRERAAELTPEQLGLAERSGAIADALAQQAEQAATAPPEQAGPESEESARRLRLAGEHVVAAQLAMNDAGGVLGDDTRPLPGALGHQATALEELEQALELLVPPEQRQQQQDQQRQQQQQEQEQQQQETGDEQAGASEDSEGEPDPSQMLQGVRDREAERRRERERSSSRYEPVEKDW
jgi:Ca-activated chloride channel family protein